AGLENVALLHERDISHSSVERIIIPDSTIILDYMINKFIEVINGFQVHTDRMLENLVRTRGLIFSQRVLLALMDKGLERMAAYDLVQRAAMKTWSGGLDFRTNLMADQQVRKHLSEKEMDRIFDLEYYLRNVNTIYKRLGI
ncbi:MAG TPA: adenylosuccinate lyase, partial [Candidatus Omnitrophota bacterium]|nr:adenylosuccinate lyase [Candidatus Omnitrophota bacterium]